MYVALGDYLQVNARGIMVVKMSFRSKEIGNCSTLYANKQVMETQS